MVTESEPFIVDSDAHVLEPPDLWERYLEDEYKERAIKIVHPPEGGEQLHIDREMVMPGGLAALGSVEMDRSKLFGPESPFTYMDGAPAASMYGPDRLKLFDEWGVQAGLALPTVGILWDVDDVGLGNAYARAYNNWLYEEFQAADRERIIGAAHLHLKDPDTALEELRLRLKQGFRAVFLPPERVDGKPFTHPDFDPLWHECEDAGIPLVLHVIVRMKRRGTSFVNDWYEQGTANPLFTFGLGATYQIVPAVCSMVVDGLFDKFPNLKVFAVEAGAGWAANVMDRLDEKYHHFNWVNPLQLEKPSDYFRRNLWFCAEPEERTTNSQLDLVGEDRILWGSDYPHIDSHIDAASQILDSVKELSPERRRLVLGENARALFGMDQEAHEPIRRSLGTSPRGRRRRGRVVLCPPSRVESLHAGLRTI